MESYPYLWKCKQRKHSTTPHFSKPMKSNVSLYDLLVPSSLAFPISQLTHPIFSPSSPPLLLHSARCKKQGRLSLHCVPPPFLHRIPPFHLSFHHSQKSHTGQLSVKVGVGAGGLGRFGWEEIKTGREVNFFTVLTLLVNKSLHNTGNIVKSSLLKQFLLCLCSKTHLFIRAWHGYPSWNHF